MELLRINWSIEKLHKLESQLSGYWAQEEWVMEECPLIDENFKPYKKTSLQKKIHFFCLSPSLNTELKFALRQRLEKVSINTLWSRAAMIHDLMEWLNLAAPDVPSLMERSMARWETSYRTYLINRGKLAEPVTQERIDGNQQKRYYRFHSQYIINLRQIYKILEEAYDDRPFHEQEIWDLRKLGTETDPTQSAYKLNFQKITQAWLLESTKKFIRYSLAVCSVGECQNRVGALGDFSLFLTYRYPDLHASALSRAIVLEYLSDLSFTGLAPGTRHRHIGSLRTFFEVCAREGWADIPDRRFIYDEDFPRIPKRMPRFIPEEVMAQLNQHIEFLSPQYMRMLLVLQEAGMRVGELCRLPFDCLSQDAQGDYFLRYYQFKMKKEHIIPISKELVKVIHEQQQSVKEQWGEPLSLLFPNSKGVSLKQKAFRDALNRLGHDKNICDASGELWRFQSHQFRHTVGTRMINAGVPHHIVQRFLGHESPEMTTRYAFIHDQTLKEEFFKFKGKIVDVTGRAVQPEEIVAEIAEGSDPNSLDDQWLKKNVLTQALPNGICGLPAVQKFCPYGANKCYSCTHFKTDIRYLQHHKEHLERTSKIIIWAQEHSESQRAADILKENFPVQQGLERIIAALEGEAI